MKICTMNYVAENIRHFADKRIVSVPCSAGNEVIDHLSYVLVPENMIVTYVRAVGAFNNECMNRGEL